MFIVKNTHDVARFLKEVKGMSFEKIAKIFNKPVKTITSWAIKENWGSYVYVVHPYTHIN